MHRWKKRYWAYPSTPMGHYPSPRLPRLLQRITVNLATIRPSYTMLHYVPQRSGVARAAEPASTSAPIYRATPRSCTYNKVRYMPRCDTTSRSSEAAEIGLAWRLGEQFRLARSLWFRAGERGPGRSGADQAFAEMQAARVREVWWGDKEGRYIGIIYM